MCLAYIAAHAARQAAAQLITVNPQGLTHAPTQTVKSCRHMQLTPGFRAAGMPAGSGNGKIHKKSTTAKTERYRCSMLMVQSESR